MGIEYRRLQRSVLEDRHAESLAAVDRLADELRRALEAESVAIDVAHVHGASSAAVQSIVSSILKDRLGFREEQLLSPDDGLVSKPRPDFFHRLGPGQGVIAEVERGGTVTNNHDLKDIWKEDIAADVQHLFLIVPNSNWRRTGDRGSAPSSASPTAWEPSSTTRGARSTC
ncbi:hypothetical protein [Phycicoccus sonneratiae]|uniref:Uncharacterized protein n=1 Tax=Phycicoccus sonneratiae TaxID=2807628 RepID=A0ABS2CN41_9MICO|nr:hypothetical protein [Phycicoccus sonneraticus]MBM6401235.1 hypothetical protein [Phycicoccus sonneraticus]